jgi:hypothetical protein
MSDSNSYNDAKVLFSPRACCAIISETLFQDPNETGGILLGQRIENHWHVIEAIDPGPGSKFTPHTFEYDTEYVNHLSKKVASLYNAPLKLVGLWHRHPGSLDVFSGTDDITNRRYAEQMDGSAISCIVNLDPLFRLTAYSVPLDLSYQKLHVDFVDSMQQADLSNLAFPSPLSGTEGADLLLQHFCQKLFSLNPREQAPLDSKLEPIAEKALSLLDELEQVQGFNYGLKACGCHLQIALIHRSTATRHLVEIGVDNNDLLTISLDNREIRSENQISVASTVNRYGWLPFGNATSVISAQPSVRKFVQSLASI